MSNGHVLMYAYMYVDYRQNNRNRRHCHIVIGLSHEKLLENSWGGLNPSEQWRVRNFLSRRTHRQDGEVLSAQLTAELIEITLASDGRGLSAIFVRQAAKSEAARLGNDAR